jgi:hypothetical protein
VELLEPRILEIILLATQPLANKGFPCFRHGVNLMPQVEALLVLGELGAQNLLGIRATIRGLIAGQIAQLWTILVSLHVVTEIFE